MDTDSVRMILLSGSTSSIFLPAFPFPFVFLPLKVSPLPLNASKPVSAPGGWTPNELPGRELPGVFPALSTLMPNLLAMVAIGAGGGLTGSLYPTGVAKSTSKSVSNTEMPPFGGGVEVCVLVSIMSRRKTIEL